MNNEQKLAVTRLDNARQRFLRELLAFLEDPSIPPSLRLLEARVTHEAVRQLTVLAEV